MSKNIKIGVKTLRNKSWIRFPDADTNGVYDYFYDTSDATATSSDILRDKVAYSQGVRIVGTYSGGSTQAQLNSATVSISNDNLIIVDGNNGTFSDGFEIYVDGVQRATTTSSPFQLSILSLTAGNTYSISVKVYGNNMGTSNFSNLVSYTPSATTYLITESLTHLTVDPSSDTYITSGGTATLTFIADNGYYVPATLPASNVIGATILNYAAYNNMTPPTCSLTIGNPTGNVYITAEGTLSLYYAISYSGLQNISAGASPTQIIQNGFATITLTPASGYSLPDISGIGVNNATITSYTVNDNVGTLVISNPTGNVTINASGVASQANFLTHDGLTLVTRDGYDFNVRE